MSAGTETTEAVSSVEHGFEQRRTEPDAQAWQHQIDTFVGREQEMKLLRSRLDDARDGKGSLVLVSGEPGIGKTRLLTEAARYAESMDMQVLWGRCWEGEGVPAFWPWMQIVRTCMAGNSAAGLESIAHGEDILRWLGSGEPLIDGRVDSESQFLRFDSLARILRLSTSLRPALLVLDDLHQADSSSIRFLEFFMTEIRHVNCLAVSTVRDLAPHPTASSIIGRLAIDPHTSTINLAGLNDDASRALMESQLSGTRLSGAQFRRIYTRTEGNPFFLIEICSVIQRNGSGQLPAVLEVPASLKSVLDHRLSELGAIGREVLGRGAVQGRSFSTRLFGRISFPRADLLNILRAAEDNGLIHKCVPHPGEYQFSHSLIREALYSALPPDSRAQIHREVAEAIEEAEGNHIESCADKLAYHYFCAGDRAPNGKALESTLIASAQARSTAAYDYAAELLQRALTLPDVCEHHLLKIEILLELGSALLGAGHWYESRAVFLQATDIARTTQSDSHFAAAAIGVKGMILAPAPPDKLSIELLHEALEHVPQSATCLRVHVLHALATATHFSPPAESQAHLAERSLELAESSNHPGAIATALEAMILAHWRPGAADAVITYAERLLKLGQSSRSSELEAKARVHLYVARTQRGETTADSNLDLAERIALGRNHPKLRWLVALLRSSKALASGNFDDGLEYANTAQKLGKKCHDETAFLHLGLNLLLRARLRGTFDDCDAFVRAGAKLTPDVPLSRLGVYCADFASDPTSPRHRALRELLDVCRPYLNSNAFSLWAQCLLAELSFLTDNSSVAADVLMALEPHKDEVVIAGWGTAIEGSAAHFVGLAYATLGQSALAAESLADAIRVNNECGWALLRARSELAYAASAFKTSGQSLTSEQLTNIRRAYHFYRRIGLDPTENPFIAGATDSPLATFLRSVALRDGTDQPAAHPPRTRVGVELQGDTTLLSYGTDHARVRTTKASRQLCWLLENPHTDIPAILLAQIGTLPSIDLNTELPRSRQFAARIAVIDDKARLEYTSRIRELRASLEQGSAHDPAYSAELREELAWLTKVLSQSKNVTGRTRSVSDPNERARISVRNNLSNVIAKVDRHSPRIGIHLTNAIRTGSLCSYRPEGPTRAR